MDTFRPGLATVAHGSRGHSAQGVRRGERASFPPTPTDAVGRVRLKPDVPSADLQILFPCPVEGAVVVVRDARTTRQGRVVVLCLLTEA